MKKNLYISKIYLCLFLGLICTINSREITFDGEKKVDEKFQKEEKIIELNINVLKVPAYTKLLLDGNEDANYVISIYSDNERENRIQLAQSYYKKTILFLAKEQIKSQIIYASIECSSTPCTYNISIIPQENILLEEGEKYFIMLPKKIPKWNLKLI